MPAEQLSQSICVPRLVLTAQDVFLLQQGQTTHTHTHTHTQTNKLIDVTDHSTRGLATTVVGR